MRVKLAPLANQRRLFVAEVANCEMKYDPTRGYTFLAVCFRDIVDASNGELLTDHAWVTSRYFQFPPEPGTVFQFTALVEEYRKRSGKDFCLKFPDHFKRIQ